MLDDIKLASQHGLVACFAGVGSAFAKKNAQTSLIVAKDGVTLLIDLGQTVSMAMAAHGIAVTDFDFYHFTHSHADHVGGVEELLLLSRYVKKRRPQVIISDQYQDLLWEKSLKGGCEYNEAGLLRFSDLAEPIRPTWVRSQPREMYKITMANIDLLIFRTIHIPGGVYEWERAFWSTGIVLDRRVLFTADTRFDPTIFTDLADQAPTLHTIFHDCQLFDPGTVHASYEELKQLPAELRAKMYLTHYGDSYERFDPAVDGFAGFAQPWHIYSFEG